jgi:hypothetical protein
MAPGGPQEGLEIIAHGNIWKGPPPDPGERLVGIALDNPRPDLALDRIRFRTVAGPVLHAVEHPLEVAVTSQPADLSCQRAALGALEAGIEQLRGLAFDGVATGGRNRGHRRLSRAVWGLVALLDGGAGLGRSFVG